MFVCSPICHYITVRGQIAALLAVDSGEENHGVLSEVTFDTNIYIVICIPIVKPAKVKY